MKTLNWQTFLTVLLGLTCLSACHEDEERGLTDNPQDFEDLRPFASSATYGAVITECVKAESPSEFCNLGTLPLLGQEVDAPTVDDVMNRLVISHDWMADRFEEMLYALPEDILPLFKGLTAVVIDDDIRPAFYTSSTGAIYLDPAYLWVTVPEKRTINIKDDYRSGFDDELAFRAWGFYTNGNTYAFTFGSLTDDSERQFEDALFSLARLLLHELAHANDFIPADSYGLLSNTMTVGQAATSLASSRPSNGLATTYPLNSQLHLGLAQVMYFGETATPMQTAITAEEAGLAFEPDGASDHYAYSNQFEDAAMLFETALMKQFFNFDYDVSFVDAPEGASACDDYLVQWGVFNRVGDTEVKARAQYIIGELLPNLDTSLFFQDLAAPTTMTNGLSWCDNLQNKTGSATNLGSNKPSNTQPLEIPHELLRRGYL